MNTEDPATEAEGGRSVLPSRTGRQAAQASTHSPLWEELLSRTTGLAGLPRTQETKGPQQWGEGRGPVEPERRF